MARNPPLRSVVLGAVAAAIVSVSGLIAVRAVTDDAQATTVTVPGPPAPGPFGVNSQAGPSVG